MAQASAACSTHTPTTGQTVTCDNTSTDTVGVNAITNNATGNTVNVNQGAAVAVTYTAPVVGTPPQRTGAASNYQFNTIIVQDNSTVNNNGTISMTNNVGTGLRRDFIGVSLQGTETMLNNNGTISVTNNDLSNGSGGATARRIYGVISSSPTDGVEYENVAVFNRGAINVTQAGTGVARGVYSGEGIDSMTIENFGSITVTHNGAPGVGGAAFTVPAAVAAIDADDDTDELNVTNHKGATITTTGAKSYTVGGRAQDYTLQNDGTITNAGTGFGAGLGAIFVYGGRASDGANPNPGAAMFTLDNSVSGVINGNVVIQDSSPFQSSTTGLFSAPTSTNSTRDSAVTNEGVINGAFTYGVGTHVLTNTGMITGGITVNQSIENGIAVGTGIGGASFTLTNSGTLGGNITINDRTDSVNAITLSGTGFSGNIGATGAGSNSLTLDGVTNLAGVQNFTNLNLRSSNVTVTNGVSLVNDATIRTRIVGQGGTHAAPSTSLGTINGTLTLAGSTTIIPTFARMTRNGDVYQLASAVNGAGTSDITVQQSKSALVKVSADTSDGRLLLVSHVRDARTIPGISQQGGATLQGLLSYNGNNPQVYRLGALVEGLHSIAQVRAAGEALAPITNGADVQTPINAAMLFHQQIDSRLDSFVYAQIPSNGRSADLGVSRPAPVYGVLPTSGAWIEGIGGGVHQGSVGGASAYNASLAGVIGGYDRLIVPGLRFGGAFGFIDGRVNGNSNFVGNREDIQTYQGLAYATWEQPNYYLRGSVGYGGVNYQSAREIGFANFSDTAFGSHSGDIFTSRGEVGLPYEYLSSLLVPYAAFTYSHLEQNAYTETSSAGAAFAYQSARNNSERSEVGGKIVVPLTEQPVFSYFFPTGSVVALEGRAAYVHEFGNVAQTVTAAFTGGGNVFVAAGPVPNRDMVDYGVGLRMGSGRVQVDLQYDGLARSNFYQQVGLLRARLLF